MKLETLYKTNIPYILVKVKGVLQIFNILRLSVGGPIPGNHPLREHLLGLDYRSACWPGWTFKGAHPQVLVLDHWEPADEPNVPFLCVDPGSPGEPL